MKNVIISVISIIAGILIVGCDVNGPQKKAEKDNELVGWWKEILDTVSDEGREYFWHKDSTKEAGGFWNYLDLAGFFNDDSCMIDGNNRYKICSDTIWLIYTGGDFKDPNGVIVSHDDPDTAVARYHISETKDTLYFVKIDHSKSRYLPNYTWHGEIIN